MTCKVIVFAAVASLLQIAPTADSATGKSNAQSHPSQRPLPIAVDRVLTRGPAYYVDPTRGADTHDGSKKTPWKSMQHGVQRLNPGDTLYRSWETAPIAARLCDSPIIAGSLATQ